MYNLDILLVGSQLDLELGHCFMPSILGLAHLSDFVQICVQGADVAFEYQDSRYSLTRSGRPSCKPVREALGTHLQGHIYVE